MKQFVSFVRKEFYHIFRDMRTMMILLGIPVILIIIFGYAITTEIRSVPVAVLDQSRTDITRKLVDRISASEYFNLYKMVDNMEEAQQLFRRNKVRLVIVFPVDFATSNDASIQLLADATDPNEATQITAYMSQLIMDNGNFSIANGTSDSRFSVSGSRLVPVVHLLYNPLMKGAYNFVPGVMGLILILICSMMTSVGIVKEKEMGTMEVLLVSPMKPAYIVIAKAIPYLLLSMVNIVTILVIAYFLLDVPIAGSLTLLVFISILYAFVALCLGLLVSTMADTQKSAMLVCVMVLMLPVILLSGMVFPIENMPVVLQWLSNIVPAKWYIIAVKDVMIKGLGIGSVLPEIAILTVMVAFLMLLSVKRFKIRL
ncbi:ABC transporter permease [Parabacteroides chinchillae]|nr:ABC transporter permease [Parabacteroides chinchillae]